MTNLLGKVVKVYYGDAWGARVCKGKVIDEDHDSITIQYGSFGRRKVISKSAIGDIRYSESSGFQYVQPPNVKTKFCKYCCAIMPSEANFCSYCGKNQQQTKNVKKQKSKNKKQQVKKKGRTKIDFICPYCKDELYVYLTQPQMRSIKRGKPLDVECDSCGETAEIDESCIAYNEQQKEK